MNILFKLSWMSFSLWLVLISLILSGCGLGPSMMRADRLTYNDAIQFTDRQELLLNIVRLRYNEGPEFLATSSIRNHKSVQGISIFNTN
jgi:hypothetical protein